MFLYVDNKNSALELETEIDFLTTVYILNFASLETILKGGNPIKRSAVPFHGWMHS